jgi:dipeptidyl aminopeptidase/acylaminoacyl peptidase
MTRAPLVLLSALVSGTALAGDAFTAVEMMKLKRLADPQVSPDGRTVLYSATEIDLAAGTRNTDLWTVPLAGGEPRRLTQHPKSDSRGRFSPDGRRIAFVSTRDGAPQVYLLPLAGGEPERVTSLSTGAEGVLWIDDQTLLVKSDVFPDCGADDSCNKNKLDEAGKPSSARVYDQLLYRHWDTWEDHRRSRLLVVPLAGGPVRDLTPGERDVPPWSLGGDDYAVSPDGKEVAFVRNDDPVEATSTNAELFVVPTSGGPAKKIAGSPGYDGAPQYSPDGTMIAFKAQMRAGYEADRWRLMVYDRKAGATRDLSEWSGADKKRFTLDLHVESFAWSRDSKSLYFTVGRAGREPVFHVLASGGPAREVAQGNFTDLQSAADGRTLVAMSAALTHPGEVYRFGVDGAGVTALTKANDAQLARFGLLPGESVSFKGAAGKDVQAWIVKPPGFDPARKYPLLVLIHGGPQSVWADGWTYRWNAQIFASAGYVVFMPNPRGSVGWGQEFIDDINGDWGGRVYEDVMKGTDYAESLPYVAKGRTVAAGASYGGYMVNWIAGHSDRYRALVSHDGVFDLVSMYGATEEIWFPEWEFKGPYWENPEMYDKWSPSRFVAGFKTPTLVIHGELDHRVPLEQGLGMFTALQRKGVPSRLLVFPDENHWVLKPANSVRWYQEVIGWLDRWAKK